MTTPSSPLHPFRRFGTRQGRRVWVSLRPPALLPPRKDTPISNRSLHEKETGPPSPWIITSGDNRRSIRLARSRRRRYASGGTDGQCGPGRQEDPAVDERYAQLEQSASASALLGYLN